MPQFILVSFCNLPTVTTSPLLCVKIPNRIDLPVSYAPVYLGCRDLAVTATGLTRANGRIYVLFASRSSNFYVAVLQEHDLSPLYYQELPEVKDGHSIVAVDDYLYVVSTGTDEIIGYQIKDKSLGQPSIIWRASDTKTDTHHINSIIHKDGEILISAFGPKEGQFWSSASNGYIFNITRNSLITEGVYHPHSLSVRNDKIYYSDSHRNTFRVVDQTQTIFDLDGYTRGVSWLSNNVVCIATSIGRRVSKSTGLIANPSDPGEAAGACGLLLGNVLEKRHLRKIDLSWFGPEIYDVLLLQAFKTDLLVLSNTSQEAERQALQILLSRLVEGNQQLHGMTIHQTKLKQQLDELKQQSANLRQRLAELRQQLVERERRVAELNDIYRSKAWRLILVLRRMRLWLVPLGSRRERVLRWALRSFRTLRAGNVRLLLHRTLNTLRDRRTPMTSSTARPVHPPDHDVYVPISEKDVDPSSVSVKVIAFYLPQFHPIPENDEWWGKGFTEWTNVTKARPNFEGHYQPQIPDELGYYDLRLPEVQKRQIELAKKYGIHGFCFYYYWFSGKRLLERPLDQYLANSDLDLPFCLCWANENWTRRWDGAEHEILIAQSYNEQEYVHFIRDISPNFLDPRYIRVDGKPILLVYRINLLPDPQEAAEIWRAECRKLGIGEIYLVAVQSFGIGDPRPFGFDAAVEFPPSNLGAAAIRSDSVKMTNPNFKGKILDYNLAAQIMMEKPHEGYTAFKAVMPSWDNTARRQNDSHIFINSSSSAYKNWLARAVTYTTKYLPEDRRFVFVNAWNEWAEGTHLEPDKLRGYAYLQATAEAITRGKFRSTLTPAWTILFVSHDANNGGAQRVLLNTIAWLKAHTKISIKILCLAGGDLLPQFQALGDTLVFTDLKQGEADLPEEEWADRLLAALHYESPDLIYGNTVVAGKAYPWLAQLRAPILTHVHEMDSSIKFYAANTMEHVLKYSSHFLSSSKAVRENLIRNYSVPEEKVSIGHASIYPDAQRTILDKMEKNRLRKKLGLAQDKFVIFGCGIGMPFRKGADLFIELAQILRRKGYDHFHLSWIGGFERNARDDRYGVWSDYLQRLAQSEAREHVTFLGYKKDPREYFQVGDVHVMTSREEPFGLVALEAADCGLSTICFENAGAADFVGEEAGYVVPFEDMEAMAQRIIHLMENEDQRARLGERAKERFLEAFTVERTTPHILSACRKVAGKKPGVSIIVPNYNHAPYLPERLESIFNQTYQDFEIILLDDCSSDNSLEILNKYADRADVQIVRNDQNSGSPFPQWLKGLDLAQADIWWIAESDDVSDPAFLECLLPAFDHPHVKLAYANSHIIDEKGAVVGDYLGSDYLTALSRTKWNTSYRLPAEQEINEALGIKDTILNVSAVLFLRFTIDPLVRSTLNKMRSSGDWYFIVQAIKGGEVYYEARKLNYHRRHSESVIGKMVNSKKVDTFYKEMSIVHRAVAENYNLSASFYEKWDQYLHDQWTKFFQDRPFDDLSLYYPIDEHRSTISRRIPEKR